MVRSYRRDLDELPLTYEWALEANVTALEESLIRTRFRPLLAVGSGGSSAAAAVMAALHERYGGAMARPATPLGLAGHELLSLEQSVWFFSARGKNPDILSAVQIGTMLEPRHLGVLCMTPGSPLADAAMEYAHSDVVDFHLTTGRDGFLATNSLLASVVLVGRAFAALYSPCIRFPSSLEALLNAADEKSIRAAWGHRIWEKPNLIVLHGASAAPGANDLESRFSEAALGPVQVADFRNFAHGRHTWLGKRGHETGVLALYDQGDREIAVNTIERLPPDIEILSVEVSGSPILAEIGSVAASIELAGAAGAAKGIDPGRPGVSTFGRSLFHSKAFKVKFSGADDLPGNLAVAIRRKAGEAIRTLRCRGELDEWVNHYRSFCAKLLRTDFGAVVFDYDGTLVDRSERFSFPRSAMRDELVRLLGSGIPLGIATGRGDSVRHALQEVIPRVFWSRIVVGYYNGGQIGLLEDDSVPVQDETPCRPLAEVWNALQPAAVESGAVTSLRDCQLTIRAGESNPRMMDWREVLRIVQETGIGGVSVVYSTHSIDVLAPGVTKRSVVKKVREVFGGGQSLKALCVGDKGAWPGNDFGLLQEPLSLSVDEVASGPQTCWNLAPAGAIGVPGTLHYLRLLKLASSEGRFRFGRELVGIRTP
jgi:hypothetical protein